MDRQRRSNRLVGAVLVLLGVWFLVGQYIPALRLWVNAERSWPLFVIGVGVILFLIGLLTSAPDMAVPACIVGGIGGLLYWQNATNRWESWAYVWTLIPGLVGVGIILAGLLKGQAKKAFREVMGVILVSLVLFVVFASFLGGSQVLGIYWPVVLVLLGLWILLKPWIHK